jgi:hypothetical protein
MRQRDIGVGQVRAQHRPCLPELPLAVIEIIARSASATTGLAVEIAGPPPLRDVRRQSRCEHDPPDGQRSPNHGVVVWPSLAADHGGAERDDFVGVIRHASTVLEAEVSAFRQRPATDPR